NGYITILDDLRFETVPAPGALAALGLGGLAASRRRR
ncbi:MAG TPA: PEP-CTERM sorting domain-containing protein, partial [Phycisphaerales bacterium]|nr:PEP-CTERM sorting domain-containing protein [Phycisphaerales bacterium]